MGKQNIIDIGKGKKPSVLIDFFYSETQFKILIQSGHPEKYVKGKLFTDSANRGANPSSSFDDREFVATATDDDVTYSVC